MNGNIHVHVNISLLMNFCYASLFFNNHDSPNICGYIYIYIFGIYFMYIVEISETNIFVSDIEIKLCWNCTTYYCGICPTYGSEVSSSVPSKLARK